MKNKKGFTLIELLVALAIVGLLVAYAIPNYREYVLRSQRVEAQNKMLEMAGLFEKHYANTNRYPTALTGGGDDALDLTTGYLQWENYQITLDSTNGWELTATAINNQVDDTTCPTMSFNSLGQKDPIGCWGN